MDLNIEIIEIRGTCPVYQLGDRFTIKDGYKLNVPSGKFLCMHSLASLIPYYTALSRGISPEELGLAKKGDAFAYLQCLDPCDYTGGGTVVFKINLNNK